MTRKHHSLRRRVGKALASALVLLIFIVPIFLTGWWVFGVIYKHDPRKVVAPVAFHVRAADKSNAPLKPFQEPVVSITFDDGWESTYTLGFPVLQKYGLHTTQYIITKTLTDPNYLSVAQLKSMESTGTQIASHTVSHPDLTTLNAAQLKHELADSQKTLREDFGGTISDFTSPYGAYNAYTLQQIGKYYRSQKNAEGDTDVAQNPLSGINAGTGFDPMNFTSYSVRNDTSLQDIANLITDAEQHNGWLVLTYHQIETNNKDEEFAVTPKEFEAQLKLISQSSIRSATVGQFMAAYYQTKGAK